MTKNRRYEEHYDQLNDARIMEASERPNPVTLPPTAFGPVELEWLKPPLPVWAWLQWAGHPAEKVACLAKARNDRVVLVSWEPSALSRSVYVWRQAVTVRHRD